MKKTTLILTFTIALFFGCSEKNAEPKKEEKSINESLAEDLLMEFQDDLDSWNACVVYDGIEYTSLDDFLSRDRDE